LVAKRIYNGIIKPALYLLFNLWRHFQTFNHNSQKWCERCKNVSQNSFREVKMLKNKELTRVCERKRIFWFVYVLWVNVDLSLPFDCCKCAPAECNHQRMRTYKRRFLAKRDIWRLLPLTHVHVQSFSDRVSVRRSEKRESFRMTRERMEKEKNDCVACKDMDRLWRKVAKIERDFVYNTTVSFRVSTRLKATSWKYFLWSCHKRKLTKKKRACLVDDKKGVHLLKHISRVIEQRLTQENIVSDQI